MKKPSSSKLGALAGKRVLLRLDLNVPLHKGRIRDDHKLQASLPIIKQLRRRSPLVILTHLGEPQPKRAYEAFPALSLAPVAAYLKRKLGGRIVLASGSWSELRVRAAALKKGDILLLENIRFWKGETRNDEALARNLASLAEAYVNDAFAVSHRRHASVAAIKKYLPAYAGPLLSAEVAHLGRISSGKAPFVLILGGAKIASKLPLIEKFLSKASAILVGGGLANTLLKARGAEIGVSFCDSLKPDTARRLRSAKIILPVDAVVSNGKRSRIERIGALEKKDSIIDIGPETATAYAQIIMKARTLFWNGPLGKFEETEARNGTKALLKVLARAASRGALTVVGGGETADAAAEFGYAKKLGWISTGGGASLAFLAGEAMPGLEGLKK